jgi:hypothetical protein
MSKRSVWKNRPDGKTVRRNIVAQWHSSRPKELLESPALRVLSRAAHLALLRIEIELRNHGGHANGQLIITQVQFIEYGIHRHQVASALRELEALGHIIITQRGRGGNAEYRQPNRFLLNYLCGAVDAHEQITNAWKRVETMEQAEEIAAAARANKNAAKVSCGHRTLVAVHKNVKSKTFPSPSFCHFPAPETGVENGKFPAPETGVTGPAPETGVTFDISGGGGAKGGKTNRSAAVPTPAEPAPTEPAPLVWSAPVVEQIEWSPYWARVLVALEFGWEADGWSEVSD